MILYFAIHLTTINIGIRVRLFRFKARRSPDMNGVGLLCKILQPPEAGQWLGLPSSSPRHGARHAHWRMTAYTAYTASILLTATA